MIHLVTILGFVSGGLLATSYLTTHELFPPIQETRAVSGIVTVNDENARAVIMQVADKTLRVSYDGAVVTMLDSSDLTRLTRVQPEQLLPGTRVQVRIRTDSTLFGRFFQFEKPTI